MARTKKDYLTLAGKLAALVAAMWALAVTAAEHVLGPHMADARQRVHVMCVATELQDKKLTAICNAVGATECASFDASMKALLLAGCVEDGK